MRGKSLQSRYLLLVSVAIAVFALAGCADRLDRNRYGTVEPNSAGTDASEILPFGAPSPANDSNPLDLLIVREHYALSYNDSRGTPNWVAWFTTRDDLGDKRERPQFQPDPLLPAGITPVIYSDYSGSGYDRGHLLPSADRLADTRRNEDTFYMTNIVPQTPALNQHPWNDLENYARSLTRRGAVIYTIAGPYGEAARLKRRVTVPTNCWKIVVVLRSRDSSIDRSTRVIAVDMPNETDIENVDWKRYLTTVKRIEERTGLRFFDKLPGDVQQAVKNRPDSGGRAPM